MSEKTYAYGPLVGFQSEKAAQVSAAFLKLAGGRMDKLKLIKFLYLFERESVRKRGRPAFYDEYYSLKDGPICSSALNGINGNLGKVWNNYLQKNGRQDVYKTETENDDRISKSDYEIIKELWVQFGAMTASQIRNWTHDNCPEYTEVMSGRKPITMRQIAEALDIENASSVEIAVEEFRSLSSVTAA